MRRDSRTSWDSFLEMHYDSRTSLEDLKTDLEIVSQALTEQEMRCGHHWCSSDQPPQGLGMRPRLIAAAPC